MTMLSDLFEISFLLFNLPYWVFRRVFFSIYFTFSSILSSNYLSYQLPYCFFVINHSNNDLKEGLTSFITRDSSFIETHCFIYYYVGTDLLVSVWRFTVLNFFLKISMTYKWDIILLFILNLII